MDEDKVKSESFISLSRLVDEDKVKSEPLIRLSRSMDEDKVKSEPLIYLSRSMDQNPLMYVINKQLLCALSVQNCSFVIPLIFCFGTELKTRHSNNSQFTRKGGVSDRVTIEKLGIKP